MWDVIIIGGGPSGLTSGVYCARKGLKILLLTKSLGGQVNESSVVENYLGYNHIDGIDLVDKFKKHLNDYTVKVEEGIEVNEIKKVKNRFQVNVKGVNKSFSSKSLIISTGSKHRMLKIPGEKKFLNKGVVFCAWCDAPLFKNKEVVVVGGGNSGLEAVLFLINIAKKIILININKSLTGDKSLVKKVLKNKKVSVVNNARSVEIKGDKFVSSLVYENLVNNKLIELKVNGVFVEVGMSPVTNFLKGFVKLNEWGEIKINELCETSVKGVFSAGDCTSVRIKQIITAAGEGCKAAINCGNYLDKL